MTIDTEKGVVRMEKNDPLHGKVVTTWKIRSGAQYEAAYAARTSR